MGVLQNLADRYFAVVPLKATGVFAPGRNRDDGDLTAGALVTIAMSATDAGTPNGYKQYTATAAAFGLAPPAGSQSATLNAEAQGIRYRDDGTAPTATVGMLISAGATQDFQGDLANLQFIAAAAGAILNASFYD